MSRSISAVAARSSYRFAPASVTRLQLTITEGHNYSIFLDRGTDKLFAYAEIESEESWQQLAQTESCRRCWSYIKELMLINSDSPVTAALVEPFHLD